MPRERLQVLSPDSTGFSGKVKRTKPQPLNDTAFDALKNHRQIDDPAKTEGLARSDDLSPYTTEHPPSVNALLDEAKTQTSGERGEAESSVTETAVEKPEPPRADKSDQAAVEKKQNPTTEEKPSVAQVRLVKPPRASVAKGTVVALRLRALNRHVALLKQLEENGFERSSVLNSAFNSLPSFHFEPKYVPQVSEPSAPQEWARRTTVRVPGDVLRAIERQVIDGDKAPRTALIVGQIEPAWFEALDNTIARLMK